jgi:hypothetical protein
MTADTPVRDEIGTIARLIARSHTDVLAGQLCDLATLEAGVVQLCDRVTRLPAADGRALRPDLAALIDDLDLLAKAVAFKLDELKRDSGDPAVGGRDAPRGRG